MQEPSSKRLVLSALLLVGLSVIASPQGTTEVRVWAAPSGDKKLYYCPKSKWYGKGPGQFMGECEAIKNSYSPAEGPCGSNCTK